MKANDIAGTVTEEQTQMIRDFGMFGMQVPEEYEGMALNNTQFARLSEIGGHNDLGVSIFIGKFQISFRKLDIYVIYISYDCIFDVIYHGKNDFWQNSSLSEKIKILCPNFDNFGPQNLRADKRYDQIFFCKWIFGSWSFGGPTSVCQAPVGCAPQPTQVG